VKTIGRKAKSVVSGPVRDRLSGGWVAAGGGAAGDGLERVLGRRRPSRAVHDPGKIVCDLTVALALGRDCLADLAVLRVSSALFGPVASDPTVSRLVKTLAEAGPGALRAIREARARAWTLAGKCAPGTGGALFPLDLDATIVIAHSDKEQLNPAHPTVEPHD
jgi:Transposase DDE domain group 1